jgi:citrate lyase beta subunit
MPIIESRVIAKCNHRGEKLEELRKMMEPMKELILNVRVGGNDFSNLYGLRRNIHQNIYQIGVVRDILIDILNVFADDYVVSGPVWEYYENGTDDLWKVGLKKELELDRLNGFIGKTAIHPSQLPVICESLMPSANDYNDAEAIVNWNTRSGVKGSCDGKRMNEVKTHIKWATKTYILGNIYGVKDKRI